MEALESARALNALLALPRLERMLRVYRTWVNVDGVEGGMALTRRELQCVLEFPEMDQHVDLLFDAFRCVPSGSNAASTPRVDLVTLLCTAAVLAQGALADKARFVFALVDLDTEDDIVEAELALVVSTCCSGLLRLGLLQEEEVLSEMDALAVAYEAFDFVELEDGDKMTFTQFLKWCVFHPRPRTLLESVSCLFAACDAVKRMKEALQERSERLSTDTFLHYNDVHLGSLEEHAESVGVVVGPVVGKVEATRAHVLVEVDARATVKCFAFVLPQEGGAVAFGEPVPTQERTLEAFKPGLFAISGLLPDTTYVLRFLGIRKSDRETCVAVVTSKPSKRSTNGCQVRLLNHRRQRASDCYWSKAESRVYEKAALAGYETRIPLLTVHLGAIVLSPQRVSAMMQILDEAHKHSKRPHEEVDDRVAEMIRLGYRSIFSEPNLRSLLRSNSNWFFEDSEAVLFSGFPGWTSTNRPALTVAEEELARLALPVWRSYIECLWGVSRKLNCFELEPEVIFAPILTQIDLQSEESQAAFTTQVSTILKAFPSSFAVLLATTTPIFLPVIANASSKTAQFGSSRQWQFIQELVEWNLTDLKRQIFFLSFHDAGSCQALISIKNTTLSLTQFICGPLIGRPASPHTDPQKSGRPDTSPTDQLIVRFGSLDRRPQYARIALLSDSQKELAVSPSRRRSAEVGDESYVQFQAQAVPLHGLREVRRILGPVVGCVAPRCARVLLECDADGEVACTAVDRLTLEEHCVTLRVAAYRPSIFTIGGLTPGRVYDLSFRTPHQQLPAFRLVVVAEDRFLDGTVHDVGGVGAPASPSYIENVVNYVLPLVGTLQADAVVHLGCGFALVHDLQRRYGMGFQDGQKGVTLQLENSVRECVRQHWNLPGSQQLLSRGAHWFPSVGILRSLFTEHGVPVSFLNVVKRVLAEYECVGDFSSRSVWPPDRYLYRLQHEVAVLMIDTLENILESAESTHFAQLPEALLSASQWEAIEYWLQSEHSPVINDVSQRTNPTDMRSAPNTLVIICDLPLISQCGERREMAQMWRQDMQSGDPTQRDRSGYLGGVGAMSWNMYPQEQSRLLDLIFGKLQRNPKFQIVFASSGAYASRTTIFSKMTNDAFQHVVVGPISISGNTTRPEQDANGSHFEDNKLSSYYSIQKETPTGATTSQQYCALELVPHVRGASSGVKFYLQHHGEARLILGPILGRITPRSARILVELDRPVPNFICTLAAPSGSQSFSAQAKLKAFTPTILKVEGLQPGTRYAIKFEGLIESHDNAWGHVLTPPWVSLSSEWLVVNRNSMVDFLTSPKSDSQLTSLEPESQWNQILAKGVPSFTAQLAGSTSHQNGDSLGDHEDEARENFNPWHIIEDEYLSEPLSSPQLLLHLGGQVNMSRAFTNAELVGVVSRLASQLESNDHDEEGQAFQTLRLELRHRLQEVYRVAWGVPPMKRVLGYCSNLMLLNDDSDLYFTRSNLRAVLAAANGSTVSDSTLAKVVGALRGVAFELWQLYQNQLWVDLAERELVYGSKSSGNKAAFATTFGISRVVVANVSHEVSEYINAVEAETSTTSSAPAKEEAPNTPAMSLFSAASWKVLDEALESSQPSDAGPSRVAPTRPKNPVQQLVLVISGDVMAWGGSKTYPALRSEIVKLFEKVFAWKFADRGRREISVVCCRSEGSSITFEVTDEKLSEKLTLTCVGSVSEPRELRHRDQKKVKGAVSVAAKTAPIAKGHFSKRFSYRSITQSSSSAATTNTSGASVNKPAESNTDIASRKATRCRTFVSYRFITDYRRGFFDETLRFFPPRGSMPKAVLGPVIGRIVLKESPKEAPEEPLSGGDPADPVRMHYSVPILLEINADARVVCVVTDILANEDFRVAQDLERYQPRVFHVAPLVPERRYVYRFEGIANSKSRRGSFHTPPRSATALSFLALSSNFPEQMEETTDSLWSAIKRRVQVSWCGLDMILHLGGQVPMHEAALECFEWARRELTLRGKVSNGEEATAFVCFLRRKVRQRLQQRYRVCWNVPNVRETLAHASNLFLRSQADIAPFFRNHEEPVTDAAQIVLSEAKKVVADYQLSLMQQDAGAAGEDALELVPAGVEDIHPLEQPRANSLSKETQVVGSRRDQRLEAEQADEPELGKQTRSEDESGADNPGESTDTAQFIQTGEVGIFMCDVRSTPRNDVVTCNNRLMTPLTHQERAIIGEKQWLQLEKALKKKAVMVFVLCMELPLVLTDSKYVDSMREEGTLSGVEPDQEETAGRWKLYDRQALSQHWVSCRRQLEQLLNLLFRWKAKHRGRDVIVLSGGMRVGLETLLRDRETKLTVRSLTVGPLTARVEPGFDDMPLSGTACPTFLGSASQRDERFTFAHSIVTSKNYLLTRAVIAREQVQQPQERGEAGGEAGGEARSASIETEFIADDGTVDAAHPVDQQRRFPSWWTTFVPMGKCVFWDDTVMMRAQSDEDVTALTRYLRDGREFTAALEVLFEKHQFAEAARMEELRSKHRRRQRGPEELRASLRAVFEELWKVLPDAHRQRLAYFRDEFVFDFLLAYLAPTLFESNTALDEAAERPPLEFAAFSALCRDFIFNACVLRLSLTMQQEEERRAAALQRAEAIRQATEREAERLQQEQRRAEEEAELVRLQQEDPEEYAKRKIAAQEGALRGKQARAENAREQRKADKMRDVEEELVIAKEQRKLDKLAESGADAIEFTRRRELLAARIRKLDERKRHREADEARRREKKEKKRKERAAPQKES